MRKKIQLFITATLLLFVGEALAQQGFGTNQPDKSSAVDIVSSKRGLLIPRVELTQTTSSSPIVQTPAESLLVYNTATAGDVTPGFYYWEVNKWVRFVSSSTEKTVTVSEGENVKVEKDETGTTTDYKVSVKGGGTEGHVLVTKADGTGTEWIDPVTFIADVITTASNGLTKVGNDVQLGGALTGSTEIVTDNTNTLAIKGLETVDSDDFVPATQKIVIMGNDGVLKLISSTDIVKANEAVTIITDNGNGTYTYKNEADQEFVIDVPQSVINQFDNIYNGIVDEEIVVKGTTYTTFEEYLAHIANESITFEDNDFVTVTGSGTSADPFVVSIKEGVVDSMLITNAAGALEWATIADIVKANETLTVLTYDNTGHILTYKDENGDSSSIDLNVGSVSYDEDTNKITYKNEAGVDTDLNLNNTNLAYDEPTKSLTYTNSLGVDQTINLGTLITDNETVTLLVLNDGSNNLKPEGTFTYYNESEIGTDGNPLNNVVGVTIDPNLVKVEDKIDDEGTYIFKDAFDNIIATIDVNSIKIQYDNSDSSLNSTNVKEALDELANTIINNKGDLTVDGGIEFYDTTDGSEKLLGDVSIRIADEGVTNSKLADGTVSVDKMTSHTTANGTADPAAAGTVPVADGAGNVTYEKVTAENIAEGKALTSNSITVSPSGANALLAETDIEITPGTTEGQVMVTTETSPGSGIYVTGWVDAEDLENTVTADNGLTKTDNNIQLGGELISDTEIDATNNTLAVKGLQNSTATSTSIVLVDETTGVLRNVARSLEYTANSDFVVATQTGYNKFVQEITIMATIGGTDLDITLPTASNAKGQVINVKIANDTEPSAYVNIPGVDGVTIYGSMPYQGWIIKSNGTSWSVVGRM